MFWQILDPDFAAFEGALPEIEGCAVSLCRVVDHREALLGVEQDEIGSMVEKRQFGFSSGRHCAHLVQAQLGLEPRFLAPAQLVQEQLAQEQLVQELVVRPQELFLPGKCPRAHQPDGS